MHCRECKWTLVEDKMRTLKGECAKLSFNKCPIYTHDDASAKFSANSHETDSSAGENLGRGRWMRFIREEGGGLKLGKRVMDES